jgi:hypothetical protein
MQMALLRKDQLESLIKILNDLESGQAIIKLDIENLLSAATIVKQIIEKEDNLPPGLKPLPQAVNLFLNLWRKVTSTILVQAPARSVAPPPPSEEEQHIAEEE